jgi:HlyD family secretion protein
MKYKVVFFVLCLSILGLVVAFASAFVQGREKPVQPPAFAPVENPYPHGLYADGIVEGLQGHGENINLQPEVAGVVTAVLVQEGQSVTQGQPLLTLDDTVQRAQAEQARAQAAAAAAQLEALKAQPRKETLEIARAQVEVATAAVKTAEDQSAKLAHAREIDAKAVSKDALDNASNAAKTARANLELARRQWDLTKAGAWIHDIHQQERQAEALDRQAAAAQALLDKYTIKAPVDGVILAIRVAVGGYVSPQGTYATYTQGLQPILAMSTPQDALQVRCYIDEILISRLPPPEKTLGRMFVRGTNLSLPLTYVRRQPYVTPKIQLSNQRQERVDLRVLPLLFRFERPRDLTIYPGQLVDVYIGEEPAKPPGEVPANAPGDVPAK